MSSLTVSLADYSMMIIKCERGIAAELSDYFSFFVPGYKFMPAFKNRIWDGKIRLFNQMTNELNAGLFPYLIQFSADRNYELIVQKTSYGMPDVREPIERGILDDLVTKLSLPFDVRDYQYDAILAGLSRHRAVLLSPTGSGKSLIIYILMRYFTDIINNGQKVLVIVPTTSLVEQMHTDFAEYGMDVERHGHKIYSGKDKNTSKQIIISTWQSIYKFPKAWFEQFGMVIGDECHGFKSKSLSSIMNKATKAKYRFGTTGTLDGTQTHKLVLEGLFGIVYQVTKTKILQDQNTLAPLDIKILLLKYSQQTRETFGKKSYQDEIDFIIKHEKRNKFIRNLALSQKGNTLVLFHRVDAHGKVLYDLIKDKAENDRKVFFVSGDTETTDREAIRRIVEGQKDAVIVASMGTFSTGINIRNLHNIIFASPSKSQIKVLQSIGRGLRKSDDGSTTQLFDIADDLHWKGRQNFTLVHSAERVKIYSKEEFKYNIIQVDIE